MAQWLTSFLRGFGSVFNLFGVMELPEFYYKSDAEALAGDWRVVGDTLRACMTEGSVRDNVKGINKLKLEV